MKSVFLFPGQGAQYPCMGKDLWERSAAVRELFGLASEVTGIGLERLLFEGSAEDLKATDKAQAAITLVNLSAAAVLKEEGILPDAAAGFSLGEYAALYAAGVLPAEAVFSLVKFRGSVMEKAARALDTDAGPAGMAAVMGLDLPEVRAAIEGSSIQGLYAANYNSPSQTVVSGTAQALGRAEEVFRAAGAKRCIKLKVSGPFHSPLMAGAQKELEAELAKYSFASPGIPVYSNVTGKIVRSGEDAKRLAVLHLTSPVLWVDIERALRSSGYERALEVGPGTVLAGLWKALESPGPVPPCLPAGTGEAIEALRAG